jgi:hypothetical protein
VSGVIRASHLTNHSEVAASVSVSGIIVFRCRVALTGLCPDLNL